MSAGIDNRSVLFNIERTRANERTDVIIVRGMFRGRDADSNTEGVVRTEMPRRWIGSSGASRGYGGEENLAKLISGGWAAVSRQTGATVGLRRADHWLHVIPPPVVSADAAVRKFVRHAKLSVLYVGYDPEERRWTLRHVHTGKPQIEIIAGPLDAPAATAKSKSPALPKALVPKHATVADLLIAIVDRVGVSVRALRLRQPTPTNVELTAVDGLPLEATDLESADLAGYEAVTDAESPAGAALRRAIEKGDPDGVVRALKGGASTEAQLPETHHKPLAHALLSFKIPGYADVIRTLLEVGADFRGSASEDPAIIQVVDWGRSHQPQRIEALQLLLRHGADVNARSTDRNAGCTALHVAASHQQLAVVKFLLANGADPNLTNARGYKPCDVIGHRNRFDPEDTPQLIRDALAGAERGELTHAPPPAEQDGGFRRMKANFGDLLQHTAALTHLAETVKSDPGAATPQTIAWLTALSAPPTLSLARVDRPKFRAPRQMNSLGRELQDLGFEEVGVFRARELKGLLVAGFVQTSKSLYAAAYEWNGARATDVVQLRTDGSSVTATNLPAPDVELPAPRHMKKLRLPGARAADLVAAVEKTAIPDARVQAVAADPFAPTFVRVYQEQMAHARRSAYRSYLKWVKTAKKGGQRRSR